MSLGSVNKDLPIPLYHQLKDSLLRAIEAGNWKEDQQLPNETRLAEHYGVSKITVRQALQELASMGYIRREQGRGTFVAQTRFIEGPRELMSFTEPLASVSRGGTSSSPVRSVTAKRGPPWSWSSFEAFPSSLDDDTPTTAPLSWAAVVLDPSSVHPSTSAATANP